MNLVIPRSIEPAQRVAIADALKMRSDFRLTDIPESPDHTRRTRWYSATPRRGLFCFAHDLGSALLTVVLCFEPRRRKRMRERHGFDAARLVFGERL